MCPILLNPSFIIKIKGFIICLYIMIIMCIDIDNKHKKNIDIDSYMFLNINTPIIMF
jgi:hypothetical protein